ncbi:MAG: hypothetical protein WC546_03305 [Candidatus Omnitrophota bacterium]
MKQEGGLISINTIKFIIKHPWLFLSPIVIIVSVVNAALSFEKPVYICKARILFEAPTGVTIPEKFTQSREDFIGGTFFVKNAVEIIKEGWPDIDAEKTPNQFKELKGKISNIKIVTDKDNKDLVYLSFTSPDADLAYKAVSATVEVIKRSTKEKAETEISTGLTFLRKQLDFYKDKLQAINNEEAKLRLELRKKYRDLSEEDKYLVDNILTSPGNKSTESMVTPQAEQLAKYEEKLIELRLQLLELEKQKETLQERLKSGIPGTTMAIPTARDIEEDPLVKQYTAAIATKQVEITSLEAQGYLPEHPQIQKIQDEIEGLEALKERRIKEFSTTFQGGDSRKTQEELMKEIKTIDYQIDITNTKIKTLEGYKRLTKKEPLPSDVGTSEVSAQVSRLMELANEKDINYKYYVDIRQQVEAAEVKERLQKEEASVKVRVIDEPVKPRNPMPSQSAKKLLLAFIAGITTGVMLAYFSDSLSNPIHSASELRELLQIPVIASIDRINTLQDIKFLKWRRNIIIISLISFAVVSNIVGKILSIFVK